MASIERLLVVDDEELNRDMLSRRLVRNGFEVKVAENGSDALAQIERREVDLVLLDAMMPGMNGLEVLKQVRATHSPEDLPVIMVTAVSESLRVAEALDLGANDYVTKPIDFAVALARIRSQLSRKSAHARQQTSDPLTGLPNRRLFHERVQAALDRIAPGEGIGPAVLLLDMDRFKLINESLGYAAGDALLGQAAERLERTLLQGGAANLPGRMAARWSGGEFAVLLEGAADTEAVARVVEEHLLPYQHRRGHRGFGTPLIRRTRAGSGHCPLRRENARQELLGPVRTVHAGTRHRAPRY
jgi:diguanylate cyclase (GGDEF)-like protein